MLKVVVITKAADPSPRTKPSRSLSHGLEALCGSPFLCDNARHAEKPPITQGSIGESVPPANITSTSPSFMWLAAAYRQEFPVEQAVDIE